LNPLTSSMRIRGMTIAGGFPCCSREWCQVLAVGKRLGGCCTLLLHAKPEGDGFITRVKRGSLYMAGVLLPALLVR
jgi:hypothetical protein